MSRRTIALLSAALLSLAACVDLNEDLISGLANQPYPTPDVFQALVNASYEPLRSFYAGARVHAHRVRDRHLYRGRRRELQVRQRVYGATEPRRRLHPRHLGRLLSGDQHGQHGDRPGGDGADGFEPQDAAPGRSAPPPGALLLRPGADVRAAHPQVRPDDDP